MQTDSKLRLVKVVHTLVWAIFAGSILAIPCLAFMRQLTCAWVLVGLVFVEVMVLAFNGMKCPLTGIAERYTSDRRDNFDIYLPLWLARYNKQVFGALYVAGVGYTLLAWIVGGGGD
jgi:hypothetical protein